MGNRSGKGPIPPFERGKIILAKNLNRLVDAANTRVLGGGNNEVEAVGKDVRIKGTSRSRHPATDTIVIELGSPYTGEDAETGEYEFTLYKGSGPDTGRAIELHGREGLPEGTRVIARRAAGVWWFDAAGVEVWYEITSIQDDTLGVKLLQPNSNDVVVGAEELTIWRAWELQRQAYEGLTIDGITYTYTSSQERHSSGDAEEDEIIIPVYVVGARITANLVVNGFPGTAPSNRLVDCNRAGRAWAKKFA